jgi:hypothetical protein
MPLVFDDLFVYAERSIASVQIHNVGNGVIGLVTEPCDNPGQSSINAAEYLHRRLHEVFADLGEIRIFVRMLLDPERHVWTELLAAGDGMAFRRDVPAVEVESLCPDAASLEWGMEDFSCAALGGSGHPLLQLVPPPEPEYRPLAGLTVVAVADLPWGHNPSRCAHSDRFRAIAAQYPDERRTPPAVGAQWFVSLTDEEFQACEYHGVDWVAVAATSVEILETVDAGATNEDIIEEISARLGDTPEAQWCLTLFSEPIVCRLDGTSVTNGQHRTCALKAAGAPFCVVDTRRLRSRRSCGRRPQAASLR